MISITNFYDGFSFGVQLSVERMVNVKLAMAASEHPSDKLEGLVPRPQNFHKQCIVMQVFNSVKESKAKQSNTATP
jgi:hypothetical protein